MKKKRGKAFWRLEAVTSALLLLGVVGEMDHGDNIVGSAICGFCLLFLLAEGVVKGGLCDGGRETTCSHVNRID